MQIVLDGSPLTVATGGIRRYTEELAVSLRVLGEDDEITLICDRPLHDTARLSAAGIRVVDSPARGWRKRWWSLGASSACRERNAAVFHGTDFTVPYQHRCPCVLTIHDLSPWRFPHWQPQSARIRRRTPLLLRLGMADMVTTPSEAIRQEALERFALDPSRVVATPLAADSRFRPWPKSAAAPPFAKGSAGSAFDWSQRYFLFVGTNEPRKNLATLTEAWAQLRPEGRPHLCIAGRMRDDGFPIPDKPGLTWLGSVDDGHLPWLYSHATAVLYPSHYEGFGLPVLEAMQCGSPVVAGDAPALAELVRDAGILLPPDNVLLWREAMQSIADNEVFRNELAASALRRAALYSWEATARRTRGVYQEAIARFGR